MRGGFGGMQHVSVSEAIWQLSVFSGSDQVPVCERVP
jgi:hypothetical protein